MIIRVTLKSNKKDGANFVMLFGDSYKTWQEQFTEFMFRYYTPRELGWRYSDGYVKNKILHQQISFHSWKSWGGLKWCNEDEFQEELNREGVQRDEPDNPSPRQYDDILKTFKTMDRERLLRPLRRY